MNLGLISEIFSNFWLMLRVTVDGISNFNILTCQHCLYTLNSTDAVAFLNSHFGASSGTRTVYLDEVQCTGSETNLTDCLWSFSVTPTDSCSSVRSYAGVRCQGLENDITFEL